MRAERVCELLLRRAKEQGVLFAANPGEISALQGRSKIDINHFTSTSILGGLASIAEFVSGCINTGSLTLNQPLYEQRGASRLLTRAFHGQQVYKLYRRILGVPLKGRVFNDLDSCRGEAYPTIFPNIEWIERARNNVSIGLNGSDNSIHRPDQMEVTQIVLVTK